MSSKRKKSIVVRIFSIIGSIVFFVMVSVVVVSGLIYMEENGVSRKGTEVEIEIPKGASTADIANILKNNGIIGSTLVFRFYSKNHALDGGYQYGKFKLKPGATYPEIISILHEISDFKDSVKVTMPEGFNAFEIAAELEKAGLVKKDEFLNELQNGVFEPDFISQISSDSKKLIKLEGFLFPDTYEFYKDVTPKEIINTMLKNFENKALTPQNLEKLKNSNYTLEQWVIMASIVQKESANVEEMYNVSSVFSNRLNNTKEYPRLESCTTDDFREDYLSVYYNGNVPEDIDLAYNTYKREGLPIGAIANAGKDALDAVLNPNDTPYYFFVTDIEYTHYYGKDFAEHQKNIQKALAVNKKYGKNNVDV